MSNATSDQTVSVSGDSLSIVNPPSIAAVLDAIVTDSIQSFGSITSWYGVSANHPAVLKVLGDIRGHGGDYCEAITKSLDTAQVCSGISIDAIRLCESILDESTTPESIQDFITTMKANATICCERTIDTKDKFREVRQSFAKILQCVSDEPAEGDKSKWTIQFPAAGHSNSDKRLEDAMELQGIATNLETLAESPNGFINWWLGMETVLSGLERNINRLKDKDEARIKAMQKNWCKVNEDCKQYKIKITELQDHYPRHTVEDQKNITAMTDSLSRLQVAPVNDTLVEHKILSSTDKFTEPRFVSEALDAIVASAIESLDLITPWCGARTDNPALAKALVDIQKHCQVYCDVISQSVDTAQAGFGFSTDAMSLCDVIVDQNATPDGIQDFITTMKTDATNCCQGSTAMKEKFYEVRHGSIEISSRLSDEAMLTDTGEAKSKWSIQPAAIDSVPNGSSGPKQDVGFEESIKELQKVSMSLKKFVESIDTFVAWWMGMETVLLGVERNANRLKANDEARVKVMQKNWRRVNTDYMQYKTTVAELQRHYPRQVLGAPKDV